ncbi:FAD binding domain-containing protein [Propylenella binzhouense]|uniref:Xanthine dehydrogenase family protein subunit M n=1 Tax=Propylenella binzhouense TaxID=2555902 RepID=A0A964WU59_9HYPH|nr:xanthine dehydrogenase family protein subunit M [Propylenella binzhouense]MYZ48515.1 xanthine dehydrogenase family protein subunit M [Propylenella binzhouense]
MKPPPFDYVRPESLETLLSTLARLENAKILAGGQSLMPMLNLRYVFPDVLVDINRVPGLAGIRLEGDRLRIGAMTRQRAIETDPLAAAHFPILPEALRLVGHRQTRNRGTIGGSLCHLDPAAELPTVALLADATVEIAREGGTRTLSAAEFILGYMTTALGQDEVLTAVSFPLWHRPHGYSFQEFARRHGDFAIASAACLLALGPDGRIERVAIAIGGVGPVPQRMPAAEAALAGTRGEPEAVARALGFCDALDAIGDFHGSADYRRSVARSVLRKALGDARDRAAAAPTGPAQ